MSNPEMRREISDIPYMRWAKAEPLDAEYPLTQSAVPPVDWQQLGLDPRTLELIHYTSYGEPELLRQLTSRWGLPEEEILLASGTTHAHFCFAASTLKPGEPLLYESPGYRPLLDSLSLLQLQTIPFYRRFTDGFALPQRELEKLVQSSDARVLLITHLHNPSGVALTQSEIQFLVQLCEQYGVEILCDETYRPFLDPDPGPLHQFHPSIISMGSFNKVHGLPMIRVGWGYASRERVQQARSILDSTTVHNSCLSDQVAQAAVRCMPDLEARGRRIARAGWEVMGPALAGSPLEVVAPAAGVVCFPRIPESLFADGDRLQQALAQVGVRVTPGRFFAEPHHVRIAFGLTPEALTEAVVRMERVWLERAKHP
ncbi:MAG: pyridoxal phosphate-dependent aminotransferase [Planctomycetota bacterium]